jgi:hypothetical protein
VPSSTVAVVDASSLSNDPTMSVPESLPIAFASITSLIAVRTPESTSTFMSPDCTSSICSSVKITMLATFLMLISPCPNSPPVAGFFAPSPTNPAVG